MLLETTRLQNQWAQAVTVGRSKPFQHTEHNSIGAIRLSSGAASAPLRRLVRRARLGCAPQRCSRADIRHHKLLDAAS